MVPWRSPTRQGSDAECRVILRRTFAVSCGRWPIKQKCRTSVQRGDNATASKARYGAFAREIPGRAANHANRTRADWPFMPVESTPGDNLPPTPVSVPPSDLPPDPVLMQT